MHMSKDIIYFDNSATTRPFKEVIEHISEVNACYWGNPSSLHMMGIEAEKLVKNARTVVAEYLSVKPDNVYFTSGGTEANNTAVLGYVNANKRKGNHLITTRVEHASVLEAYKYLQTEGYKVDFIDVDSRGIIDIEKLEKTISANTSLVSIILVNNETGVIQPYEEIISCVKNKNSSAALHFDAVQAFGKIKFKADSNIDMLTISSHKIHGPKGVGVLYVKPGIKVSPLFYGGGQERLLRAGTENVAGISGFGLACKKYMSQFNDSLEFAKKLKNILLESISLLPADIKINSPMDDNFAPYIVNICFSGVKAEVLLHHLEQRNIFVSSGSACSSKRKIHSHVLKAMGVPDKYIEGAVRFSFSSFENSIEQIEICMQALKDILPGISRK